MRLLGIRAGKLVDAEEAQTSLFDTEDGLERRERLESAVDVVREKYGKESVARAFSLCAAEQKKAANGRKSGR